MRSVAKNFHVEKRLPFRTNKSTTPLIGIPRTVPRDMNRGYVYAMPKLIEKLNTRERAELVQMKPHGIVTLRSSTLVRCRVRTIGQKKRVLNRPREERKRDIW